MYLEKIDEQLDSAYCAISYCVFSVVMGMTGLAIAWGKASPMGKITETISRVLKDTKLIFINAQLMTVVNNAVWHSM